MLNNTDKLVVFLDADTLEYMYLTYTGQRNYPVMRKLFSLLNEGFTNNQIVTPLSHDHLQPYIDDNKINVQFLNMMGELGQVQFLQRFTVKMLQLIRVINSFFEQVYKKETWKDAFSTDPDVRYALGFNKYHSITAQNVFQTLDREKKLSQIYNFIEKYKLGSDVDTFASEYYRILWEQFPDIISQFLPVNGDSEDYIRNFLSFEDIKLIPEYHLIAHTLFSLFDAYGIQDIEFGLKDDVLLAAETAAAYLPYCNFYVTLPDIAELFLMNGIHEFYDVKVFDNNESSLYMLIDELKKSLQNRIESRKKESGKSMFRRDTGRSYF